MSKSADQSSEPGCVLKTETSPLGMILARVTLLLTVTVMLRAGIGYHKAAVEQVGDVKLEYKAMVLA